jgi:hypothetical protein
MSFRKTIPVNSENHTKPTNILCGQNAECLTTNAGGTLVNSEWALKDY